MPTLSKNESIWTIDLGEDENRFSPAWLRSMADILTQVTESAEPAVLVTTGAGKFYSNGLDLDYLGEHPGDLGSYVEQVQAVLATMLTLPVPTVAAVNGHAFGAGSMFAMAHDYRVMRSDRGYFCFPEVDIHIPFTRGMAALIQSKTTPRAAVDAMTTGHRYPAADALAAGLVDDVAELTDLPDASARMVGHLAGKDRATLGAIKSTMFATAVAALREPQV